MSVNGQDPRSNVYLLDGTLQNDFTNGPAGSAAGTALGMETIREFRVETNAYSAEFGRNCRRPDQRADQVGHQRVRRQRLRVPPQRRARRAQLLRRRAASRTSRATSSAAPSAARSRRDRLFFFVGLRGAARAARQDDLDASCPTTTRGAASCPTGAVGDQPGRRAVPGRDSRAPTAPSLGERARRPTPSRSIRRSTSTSCRAALDYNAGAAHQFFARYTLDDADQLLPTDYPQFPRDVPLAQPVLHRRVPQTSSSTARSTPRASASAARASARTSRPTPTQPLPPFVAGRAHRRRHRHRRPAALRPAELGQPAAGAERVQRAVRRRRTRAAGTC